MVNALLAYLIFYIFGFDANHKGARLSRVVIV